MDWFLMLMVCLSLLVIFLIGYLIYYLYKRIKNSTADVKNKASKPLSAAKAFALTRQFTVISPANIAKDGKFADVDFIMVGFFGVLGVKCIGLGGEIYGNANDAMWLQVTGDKRISFENPMLAAQQDARVIRDTLFDAKLKNIAVDTVVVFTNKKASLAIPRSTGHLTIKDFKKYLDKDKFEQDKGVDVAKTAQAIKKYVVS